MRLTITLKGLLSKAKLCDLTVGLNWIKAVPSKSEEKENRHQYRANETANNR